MIKKGNEYAKRLLLPLLTLFVIILISKELLLFPILLHLLEVLYPIAFGIILALLFQPLVLKLNRRMRYRRAVYLVYVGVALALLLFLLFFLPSFYEQLQRLYERSSSLLAGLEQVLHVLPKEVQDLKKDVITQGSAFLLASLSDMAKQIMHMMIAYITAFFLALDLPFVMHTAKKLLPKHPRMENFYQTMNNIVYQYLIGTAIDLGFLVISCGLILYLGGFPGAFLYASVLALLNLWPYIGATLGFFLIVLVAFVSCDQIPYVALALVWIVQQLEANVLQPFIFQKTMDVRPFLAFVFLFLSQGLFGIVGVLLSPIFAALAQIAFRSYLHALTKDQVGEWEDIWYDFDEVMQEEADRYAKANQEQE